MSLFFKWLGVFYILNLFDYVITLKSLKYGAVELNHIANFFIEKSMLFQYKLLGLIVLSFILYKIAIRNNAEFKKVLYVLKGGCIFYTLVVFSNTIVYFFQRINY